MLFFLGENLGRWVKMGEEEGVFSGPPDVYWILRRSIEALGKRTTKEGEKKN